LAVAGILQHVSTFWCLGLFEGEKILLPQYFYWGQLSLLPPGSMALAIVMSCFSIWVYIGGMYEYRTEMQRRNDKLEFERNKERLLFMKVSLTMRMFSIDYLVILNVL